MKLILSVRAVDHSYAFDEDYSITERSDEDAKAWAQQLVEYFNETCRPGEKHRELVGVQIFRDVSTIEHEWYKRTDGMSTSFRGRMVDLMCCQHCQVTGKRFGLSGNIKRDSKFRAKKYQFCERTR